MNESMMFFMVLGLLVQIGWYWGAYKVFLHFGVNRRDAKIFVSFLVLELITTSFGKALITTVLGIK